MMDDDSLNLLVFVHVYVLTLAIMRTKHLRGKRVGILRCNRIVELLTTVRWFLGGVVHHMDTNAMDARCGAANIEVYRSHEHNLLANCD